MRPAVALLLCALASGACTPNGDPEVRETGAGSSPTIVVTPHRGLPPAVAETRSKILAAASVGDYEMLRESIDLRVFLSDFGFGKRQPDPIRRWAAMGPAPSKRWPPFSTCDT